MLNDTRQTAIPMKVTLILLVHKKRHRLKTKRRRFGACSLEISICFNVGKRSKTHTFGVCLII